MSSSALFAADPVVVLDGGLGTHLAARGNDVSDALWSALILRENPAEVRAAHEDFFRAGAQVATTCSYQVTFDGLERAGADRAEAERLLRASVRLAQEAADAVPGPRWVAASVGPYGAGPGEGTEYDGAYGLDASALAAWHRPRIEILADSGADVLLAETIPSIVEVEALAGELERAGTEAMLSVTVADGRLRDGTDLAEVAAIVRETSAIRAVGVNCCEPSDAFRALGVLGPAVERPLFAYPNIGEVWDHDARQWRNVGDRRTDILGAVPDLVEVGARLIGGCCGVTPAHVATIAQTIGTPPGQAQRRPEQ